MRIGHELTTRARRMSAKYLAAQLEVATDTLVLTYERRRGTWVTGLGFDRELSALPEWERWAARNLTC
jgi:hypothetical protein